MAVDFQNKNCDVAEAASSEDTQVVMPVASSRGPAAAYVHHLTLLDIFARGYVRPLALSYVTHEPAKLMAHFAQLHTAFAKCAAMYKLPNRLVFRHDVEVRLADARLTLDTLRLRPAHADAAVAMSDADPLPTVASMTEHVSDLQRLLLHLLRAIPQEHSVASDPNVAAVAPIAPPPSGCDDGTHLSDEPSMAHLVASTDVTNVAAPTLLAAHRSDERPALPALLVAADPVASVKGERSDDGVSSPGSSRIRSASEPQLLSPLHKTAYYYSNSRRLRSLEELATVDGANQARQAMLNVVSMMRPSRLELHLLQLDRQLLAQQSSTGASLLSIGECLVHSFGLRSPVSGPVRRPSSRGAGPFSDSTTPLGEAARSASGGGGPSAWSPNSSCSSLTSWATPVSHLSADVPFVALGDEDVVDIDATAATTGPELVDSWSSAVWGRSRRGWGRGLFKLRAKYSALLRPAAFTLLSGRPLVIHAQPNHERKARKLVAALAALVPGHTGRGGQLGWGAAPLIQPWWPGPHSIRLSDITCTKLVAVAKRPGLLPKLLERYCSIWDLEAETFFGPLYASDGKLVDDLLATKKQWPDEDTYLAWLHWRLLEVASKAGLYFYLCCVGVPDPRAPAGGTLDRGGIANSRGSLGGFRSQQAGSGVFSSNNSGHFNGGSGNLSHAATLIAINNGGGALPASSGSDSQAESMRSIEQRPQAGVDSHQQRSTDWSRPVRSRSFSHKYFSASSFGSPLAADSQTPSDSQVSVRLLPVMGEASRQALLAKLQVSSIDEPIIQCWAEIVKEQFQIALLNCPPRGIAPVLRGWTDCSPCRLVSNSQEKR
eukprot:TRINITY_DN800_c0_g1_i2.p1 TRINITY_DN800_c0_g1~~TRINITY_DN800_c0_g1_i2.p1  ORF type:complete len:830 (+),score=82.66 TRINITY_DN800_c0_g1_i2:2097-4586(+)